MHTCKCVLIHMKTHKLKTHTLACWEKNSSVLSLSLSLPHVCVQKPKEGNRPITLSIPLKWGLLNLGFAQLV